MVRYAYQGGRGAGLHKKEVLFLDEQKLISMYCAGDPNAKALAEETYGESCREIARRILRSRSGADAVFQKVLDQAEKQIPAKNPRSLMFYFWKQTRNLALPQFTAGGEVEYAKAEAAQWMSPRLAQEIDEKQLRRCINEFLYGLPEQARGIFVRRYWYFFTLSEIAAQYGMREDQVQQSLERTGKELKRYLRAQELRLPDAMGFLNSFGHIREQWVTEAQRTKAHGAPWVKWVVAGVCACCILALGVWGVSRLFTQDDPAATDPVVSTTAPAEQMPTEPDTEEQTEAPTEDPEETEAPTEEPTTVPETTALEVYEPAYQKILTAYNPDQVSDDIMRVLSTVFADRGGLVDFYDGRWELVDHGKTDDGEQIVDLTIYTDIDEDYHIDFITFRYRGEGIDREYDDGAGWHVIDVPEEQIRSIVYGAVDHAGISDEVKDEFVYYIRSDVYGPHCEWEAIKTNQDLEWYIVNTSPMLDDSESYPTLFMKNPDADPGVSSYEITSIYFDGKRVQKGLNKKTMDGPLPWEE